ncbi:hypothetical protein GGS26DRAFT_353126 [Hypomontagnella submonticulosa]|nr:hypothetical protein GGS26DRAFT_353126 [Hypomontagnella submonticulosa]
MPASKSLMVQGPAWFQFNRERFSRSGFKSSFQSLGFGVTLAELAALVLALAAMVTVWTVLLCYHVLSTVTFDRRMRLERRRRAQGKESSSF